MLRKKRIILIACSVILLCISILVGTTYSLFTDSVKITNHLQAGKLDVKLVRTNLVYTILDDRGYLQEITNSEKFDFSKPVNNNIFGINSSDIYIVPGSFFMAELDLSNNGNVAIDYKMKLVLNTKINELTKQIKITVVKNNNSNVVFYLNEVNDNEKIIDVGYLDVDEDSTCISIKVEFINDVDFNLDNKNNDELIYNNLAQNQKVLFDIVVEAVQKNK